jgi:hypothetical protein
MTTGRLLAAAAVALATLAAPSDARAGLAPMYRPPPPKPEPPKREVPDYDGRPDEGVTAGDVLLALPRVVLFPVRLVVDYGVRRPIGAAIVGAERSRGLRGAFRYLFLRPKTPTPQVFPVALYDFGFKPSIGVRVLWSDGFATPGSKLSIKLGTGGLDTWRADGSVRIGLGRAYVTGEAGARQRPDYLFYGLGPDTGSESAARYQERRVSAALRAGVRLPANAGTAQVFGTIADHRFVESSYAGDPTIGEAVAAGDIAELPAGYDGYTAVATGATVSLDTRANGERRRRSGARFDATVEQVWDADDRARTWTRADATFGGALLLDPVGERKLDLKLRVQYAHAGMETEIPFTELPTAAGLRGFASGRLRGQSALALTADYQWPLSAWFDANAQLGVGNVFGEDFSGLSGRALRGSAAVGISVAGLSAERQIRLSTAVGTEPLGDGLAIDSFRLVLGFANDY